VNTLPPKTLDAVREHGSTELSITRDLPAAIETLAALEKAGIDMAQVTRELESDGVDSFAASFTEVLENIETRRRRAVDSLGPLARSVAQRIDDLATELLPTRLWAHDPTLWTDVPEGQEEIAIRMGWMQAPQKARALIPEYVQFAEQLWKEGVHRFLVLGMGGSSLAAEVFSSLFSSPERAGAGNRLGIMDSTEPSQVAESAGEFSPEKSLYLVASKSGGTAEVTAAFDFFWARAASDASRFVAITDEGTSLEQLARKLEFRRLFTADSTVGGRFSALSDFGLVPAALLGVDVARLADRAEWMQRQNGPDVPAARSPGITLGAVVAESALAGRDKLTLLADPAVSAFAHWIEQLVAESSGKDGRGVIPIALEPLDVPNVYGADRLFVYLRQQGELDLGLQSLAAAGHPVLVMNLPQPHDVAAEIFRWEMAIAVACHVLGVNAFDQPDVQDSKDRTRARIEEFRRTRAFSEGSWDIDVDGAELTDAETELLRDFVASVRPGGYVSLNAYLPRNERISDELQRMRVGIRERTRAAVAAGFGPRFQHSTGQLHKGGPNKGVFVQVVCDATSDMDVPGQDITFGTLIRAQALGDYEALVAGGRRVLRVHLGKADDVVFLRRALA
jgi:transaldolase/glucose-6-phosphate isomerase